jgi:Domain of unknown function (DUF4160)
MPIVLRIKGYRFEFYASDEDEPPHVHVKKDGKHAKFWLTPVAMLDYSERYRMHELNEVRKRVEKNREKFLEAWHDFFGRGI